MKKLMLALTCILIIITGCSVQKVESNVTETGKKISEDNKMYSEEGHFNLTTQEFVKLYNSQVDDDHYKIELFDSIEQVGDYSTIKSEIKFMDDVWIAIASDKDTDLVDFIMISGSDANTRLYYCKLVMSLCKGVVNDDINNIIENLNLISDEYKINQRVKLDDFEFEYAYGNFIIGNNNVEKSTSDLTQETEYREKRILEGQWVVDDFRLFDLNDKEIEYESGDNIFFDIYLKKNGVVLKTARNLQIGSDVDELINNYDLENFYYKVDNTWGDSELTEVQISEINEQMHNTYPQVEDLLNNIDDLPDSKLSIFLSMYFYDNGDDLEKYELDEIGYMIEEKKDYDLYDISFVIYGNKLKNISFTKYVETPKQTSEIRSESPVDDLYQFVCDELLPNTTYRISGDTATFTMPIDGDVTAAKIKDAHEKITIISAVMDGSGITITGQEYFYFKVVDSAGDTIYTIKVDCSGNKPVASTDYINPDYADVLKEALEMLK